MYRITDTCKNITLATTSLRPVITDRTMKDVIEIPDKTMISFDCLSVCVCKICEPEGTGRKRNDLDLNCHDGILFLLEEIPWLLIL